VIVRYEAHYALPIGRKKTQTKTETTEDDALNKKRSKHCQRKIKARKAQAKIASALEEQFTTGRLYGKN